MNPWLSSPPAEVLPPIWGNVTDEAGIPLDQVLDLLVSKLFSVGLGIVRATPCLQVLLLSRQKHRHAGQHGHWAAL